MSELVREAWVIQCHDKFLYGWNGKKSDWTSYFSSAKLFHTHPIDGTLWTASSDYDKANRTLGEHPCAHVVKVEIRLPLSAVK